MTIRIAIMIWLTIVVGFSTTFGQECQDCKTRRVIMYDNEVNVPRPSASADSIFNYWNYFFIAGGVRDYVANTDPTRECIMRLDGAFFTVPDTVTSSIKFGLEHANTPPAGSSAAFADYLLYGVVTEHSCTLKLESAKTRELVKSGVIALPAKFDPIQIGRTLAAFVGPLYTTIMDFERRRRDQGEPYAIQPKIILTPAKTKIKVNEKTDIDVLFRDCDGAPLKQRHIAFTADGGTLKSAEVSTDDQGHAKLEFTAGPVAALGNVTTVYPFEKPTGFQDAADVEPASIQIDKPSDSWYVRANFRISNAHTNEGTGPYTTSSGASKDWTDIAFNAWVKNISPLSDQFISDPQNFKIDYSASYGEFSYNHSHYETANLSIDTKSNLTGNALAVESPDLELDLNIAPDSYSFGISQITAAQNGTGQKIIETCDPFVGKRTTTEDLRKDPETILGLWVGDETRDTTYTTTDISEAPGIKTTKVTTVIQKCSWKNNTCILSYKQTYSEDTRSESAGNGHNHWDQTYSVSLILNPTGDPVTGVNTGGQAVPSSIVLNQNYPNPFNASTVISYSLPRSAHTTLTIMDLLGRTIKTLVDDEQPVGTHLLTWNAGGLSSGIYFLQMRSGGFVETRKLILAK